VLRPQDVGHRVVVRRRAGVRDNRPIFTDALGELVELTETHVTVRTRAGLIRVPTSEIARAKRVPDRRRPTATEALELVAAAGWPAPETDRLGDWLLRAAGGWTKRGNSALPIGDPGRPDAVEAVEAWYRARGLRPAITVALPLHARLDADLARRGWHAEPLVLVQTAPLAFAADEPAVELGAEPAVELAAAPSAGWLAVVAGWKGELPAAALHILTAVPQVRFASVYAPDGAPVAVARGVVTEDWLGISLVVIDPAARRQGLAGRLTRALAAWAVEHGATRAYLQVEEDNEAAVRLYARLGFTTHHTYRTWLR
jgi:ribosomal protein S18 acetylase RimI-like enzyme